MSSTVSSDWQHTGAAVAIIIILSWLASLSLCLQLDMAQLPLGLVVGSIMLRTFLQTGLFITTHEAIHGHLSRHLQLNAAIGQIAANLYALLRYRTLRVNHQQHHAAPATDHDPDFHPGPYWQWYLQFMGHYLSTVQFWATFVGITVIFWPLMWLGIPMLNLVLFWILPIALSSLQLFTFGVYLPHRPIAEGYCDLTHTHLNNSGVVLSFITCYHFGYHWEHHRYPHVPWYQLPCYHRAYSTSVLPPTGKCADAGLIQ